MEVRALAIAFFYAIGTAIGGITGPLVFESLASSGDPGKVAIGYLIGAAVMAFGGIVELFLGIRAEGEQLEDIAAPLTAEAAEGEATTTSVPSASRPRNGIASAPSAIGPVAGDTASVRALPRIRRSSRPRRRSDPSGSMRRSTGSPASSAARGRSRPEPWPVRSRQSAGGRAGSGPRSARPPPRA